MAATIFRRTSINHIEIARDGAVTVFFAKELVEGDKVLGTPELHSCRLEPGTDVEAVLAMELQNLARMGETAPETSEIARFRSIVSAAHSEEIVAAHRARQEAYEATRVNADRPPR